MEGFPKKNWSICSSLDRPAALLVNQTLLYLLDLLVVVYLWRFSLKKLRPISGLLFFQKKLHFKSFGGVLNMPLLLLFFRSKVVNSFLTKQLFLIDSKTHTNQQMNELARLLKNVLNPP